MMSFWAQVPDDLSAIEVVIIIINYNLWSAVAQR